MLTPFSFVNKRVSLANEISDSWQVTRSWSQVECQYKGIEILQQKKKLSNKYWCEKSVSKVREIVKKLIYRLSQLHAM